MQMFIRLQTCTNVDNVMKEKEQVLERSNDSEKHVSGEGRWDFPTIEVYKHGKSAEMDSNCGCSNDTNV